MDFVKREDQNGFDEDSYKAYIDSVSFKQVSSVFAHFNVYNVYICTITVKICLVS